MRADVYKRQRISREADINLSVAKKLRDRLKGMGYQVVMTRDTDNFITLQDLSLIHI